MLSKVCYLVLLQKGVVQYPGGISDHLIYVATVPHPVVTLVLIHDGLALVLVSHVVAADTYKL